MSKHATKSATWKILNKVKPRSWLKVFKNSASHRLKTLLKKKSWRRASNVSKLLVNCLQISKKNGLRAINFHSISVISWQRFKHQQWCSNQDNNTQISCSTNSSQLLRRHLTCRQNLPAIWKIAVWFLELQPQENKFELSKVS